MAWAQATAADYIDMLRLLTAFATGTINAHTAGGVWIDGTNAVVGTSDKWTKLTNGGSQPALPGSGSATDGELYLQGQGSSGTDTIIVGMQTYRNAGNNVFGIKGRGYTTFDNTLTFDTMPGLSPPAFVALSDTSFTCFFWVNSRRIMIAARIGTTDILWQFGYPLPFATASQYPYPLMITGSVQDATYNFQQNNYGQSCMPDPCPNGCQVRWIDGTWLTVQHYNNNNAARANALSNSNPYMFQPLRDNSTTDNAETDNTGSEIVIFTQFAANTEIVSITEISALPLYPVVLTNANQLIAQVDGLYVVPGNGLSAGDTLTVGSDTYDVFHNTWRTEFPDFFAMKRA
jgi:hypothetical protein